MKTITWDEAFDFLSKFKVCFDNGYIASVQVCGEAGPAIGVPAYITLYRHAIGRDFTSVTISKEDNLYVSVADDGSLIVNSAHAGHKYQSVIMPMKKAPYVDYSEKTWSATETS